MQIKVQKSFYTLNSTLSMLTLLSTTLTVGVGFFFLTYHCLGFGSRNALCSGPWIGGVSVRRQSDLRLIDRDTICPAFRSGFQILLKNKCMAIRKGTELPPTCTFPPTSSPPSYVTSSNSLHPRGKKIRCLPDFLAGSCECHMKTSFQFLLTM